MMVKNVNKKKKSKRLNAGSTRSRNAVAPTHELRVLPVRNNSVTTIRRALQRTFILNASSGIDGYSAFDIQMVFYNASVNWRINGTSIYTDSVPNSSEFTNLFDQWRLAKVFVRIDSPLGASNGLPGSGVITPQLLYAPDYDDAGAALS